MLTYLFVLFFAYMYMYLYLFLRVCHFGTAHTGAGRRGAQRRSATHRHARGAHRVDSRRRVVGVRGYVCACVRDTVDESVLTFI
jgi:hypothetical protein